MRPNVHTILRIYVVCLASLPASCVQALNANWPPGQNFDLSHWSLTVPVDSSGGTNGTAVVISPLLLAGGYTNSPYFDTSGDGAMVFECPAVGATTLGSANPRTELREMLNPNDNSVDWTANGVSRLTGQCKVAAVANGGELAIAQIHAYNVNIPLLLLYYDNTSNQGTIEATVKYNTNNVAINGHTDNLMTFTNVGLNSLIDYQIIVSNGVVLVTVNGLTQSQNLYATDTNWANVTFYFKAGDYYVDNGGTSDSSQVLYYLLNAMHLPNFNTVAHVGSNLILDGAGGVPRATYYVLSSTNFTRPLTNWTRVATNIFDSYGNFRFTNALGPARQNFILLQLK